MSDSAPWFSHPVRVRFQDVDAAGIVFFARAFDMFHDAYVEGLRARGVDLAAVLSERRWGAPLTHAEARFRRPMRFGDALIVELYPALGERDLVVRYRVVSASDRAIEHASGATTHAFIERETFSRAEVPPEVRAAFA